MFHTELYQFIFSRLEISYENQQTEQAITAGWQSGHYNCTPHHGMFYISDKGSIDI